MKKPSLRGGIILFFLCFCALALVWAVSGCTSTKRIEKTYSDSSASKDDSIRLLKSERDHFERLYNEMIYAGVVFDTVTLHDTTKLFNTVYITKDGEIKATGNIKSANFSRLITDKIIAEKDRLIDSLRAVKEKVKVVTETKTVNKKTTVFPWWFLIIAAGVFIVIKKMKFI